MIDCPADYACRICKQRYNISICDNRERKESSERGGEGTESSGRSDGVAESRPEVSANISSTNASCILLQTATAGWVKLMANLLCVHDYCLIVVVRGHM